MYSSFKLIKIVFILVVLMNQKYHPQLLQCFQMIPLSHSSMKYNQLKWIWSGLNAFKFHIDQIPDVIRFSIDVIKHVVNEGNPGLLVKVLLSLTIATRPANWQIKNMPLLETRKVLF